EATHRAAHVLDRINPPRAAVDLSPRPPTFGCELVEGRHDAGSKLAHERILGEVVELGADQVHAGERGLHAWIFERIAEHARGWTPDRAELEERAQAGALGFVGVVTQLLG